MFVILMATYNGEQYIKEQIDSILEQSYTDWFLFVSDDGSSDRTISILNSYVKRFPEKIRVIINRGNRHGAKENFNHCIVNAPEGDYYVFCDQDDVWDRDKLKILSEDYEKLENDIPQLIYHEITVVDESLNVLGERLEEVSRLPLDMETPFQALCLGNYVPGCGMSFNLALKKILKPAPEKVFMHDWWTLLIAAAFGEIHKEDKSLLLYRQHGDNTCGLVQTPAYKEVLCSLLSFQTVKKRFASARTLKKRAYQICMAFLEEYGRICPADRKSWVEKDIEWMTSKHKVVPLFQMVLRKNYWGRDVARSVIYWFVRIYD